MCSFSKIEKSDNHSTLLYLVLFWWSYLFKVKQRRDIYSGDDESLKRWLDVSSGDAISVINRRIDIRSGDAVSLNRRIDIMEFWRYCLFKQTVEY